MTKVLRRSFKRALAYATILAFTVMGALVVESLRARRETANGLHLGERSSSRSPAVDPAGQVAPAQNVVKLSSSYGRLPLSFESNRGQTADSVHFLSHGRGYSLYLTNNEAVLRLAKKSPVNATIGAPNAHPRPISRSKLLAAEDRVRTTEALVRMRLLNSNPNAAVAGGDELPGKVNYFIGKDRTKWRTNVPTYAQVKYRDIYPGVDLVYHGSQDGHLEYDFIVAPGADPGSIGVKIDTPAPAGSGGKRRGFGEPQVAANGDLVARVADGAQVQFHKPIVYQEQVAGFSSAWMSWLPRLDGSDNSSKIQNRKFVEGRYVLTASHELRFELGPYDRSKPLVIDPVLSYATFLGGSSANLGSGIAVDSTGDAYVVGSTFSVDFPTMNAIYGNHGNDNGLRDAFVTELNPTGSALIYSTYLGGSDDDEGYGIGVDSFGAAYVVGITKSDDFPTTNGVVQSSQNGTANVFVAKLSPGGGALGYSTYLGGGGSDFGRGIAVDSATNAYITGSTTSGNFPLSDAFQSSFNGSSDAFVAKLNAGATSLVYSTYLGGSISDYGQAIAIDTAGDAYVTGYTSSFDFPTVNAFEPSQQGPTNAFVAKFNPAGNGLLYSTYLGGFNFDYGYGIAVNSSGNAFVTGATDSNNSFPIAGNAYQSSYVGGLSDVFVTEVNAAGNGLVYSTYLGGTGQDIGYSIALDASGDAFVTGATFSTDFPLSNQFQNAHGNDYGAADAFVTMLNGAGSQLTYSSYLGGNNTDSGYGIAVDMSGNTYVTGQTSSSDFPVTANAFQDSNTSEIQEAFIAQIAVVPLSPAISVSPNPLTFTNQTVGTTSPSQAVTLSNGGTGPLNLTSIVVNLPYSLVTTSTSCPYAMGTLVSGGTCTIDIAFAPTTTGTATGTVTITDNAPGSPQTVALTGMGVPAIPVGAPSPGPLSFGNQTVNTTSPSQPVTLNNTGTAPLLVTNVSTSGSFAQSNNCVGSVAAGASCTINVTFTPTAIGAANGTLTIIDNNNGTVGSTQTVSLGGTGTAAVAGVSPPSVTFGNQIEGTTSPAQTVTLNNTGNVPLAVTSITPSASFGETDNCAGSVAASSSCMINVTFTPTAAGLLSGTLTITDNNNGGTGTTQTVTLSGTGTAPVAAVSPSSVTFTNQGQGTTSTPQAVTLSNTGNAPLTIASVAASTNFGQTNNCGTTVAASASCTINVTFTPSTVGALNGMLTITDNSGATAGTIQTVTLSGTGGGVPIASLAPSTTLNLGNTIVSSSSAPQVATLSNTGSASLTLASVAVTTNFAQSNNCGTTLAAGSSCTINITFSSSTPGALSGVLTVTDNSNEVTGSTQTLNLTGTGEDFSVTSTTGPQAVTQGGQAVYTINVGQIGGSFTNPVALACSSLPAGTTCTFASTPVTPGANGTSTQLTLTTMAPTAARVLPPISSRPPATYPPLLLGILLASMSGLCYARSKTPRWFAAGSLLFGVLAATTFLAGCGAGGFPLPKVGGTATGVYTITVTGTSGSLQHSTTITLTVTAS